MSVLTGIAPSELLALDAAMFSAVLDAAIRVHGDPDKQPSPEPVGEPERVGVTGLAELATNVERRAVAS